MSVRILIAGAKFHKNLELDWDHKDPADRTIVATAMLLSSSLVTSDRMIKQFYAEAVW